MAKLVSKVYGDALFETALEKDRVDVLYEEVCSLIPILQGNPELTALLNNPPADLFRKGDRRTDGIFGGCG